MRLNYFRLSFLSLCFFLMFSGKSNAQIVNVMNLTLPSNPTSCTNTSITMNMQINCINWVFDSTSFSVSGDTIFIGAYYSSVPFCLGAISFPSHPVGIGMVPGKNYTIVATGYDDLAAVSTVVTTLNIISCCNATPSFNSSTNSICPGDTVTFVNTSSNDSAHVWYVDNMLIGSLDSFEHVFNTPGNVDVKLIVYGTGCADSTIQSITVNSLPAVNLGPDVDFCEGTSTTLDAGSGWADVSWSNGDSTQTTLVSLPGDYSATVTDGNGCINSDTISVTELPAPVVDLGGDTVACSGTIVFLNAGNAGAMFSWNTGDTVQTIPVSQPGGYAVTVTGANGCDGYDSAFVLFTVCNGLSAKFENRIELYPNPVEKVLTLKIQDGTENSLSYVILGADGREYQQGTVGQKSGEGNIRLEKLEAGIYYIQISNGTEIATRKIVKR